ncbi:MAG: biopolymer transporter ExbD, partial [Singulisphaera sp.]
EDVEVGTLATPRDAVKTGRRVVTARKDRSLLEGEALSGPELSDRLKGAVAADPATWVLLLVPGEITFADVRPTIEAIRAGGVATIRLAPADPSP